MFPGVKSVGDYCTLLAFAHLTDDLRFELSHSHYTVGILASPAVLGQPVFSTSLEYRARQTEEAMGAERAVPAARGLVLIRGSIHGLERRPLVAMRMA